MENTRRAIGIVRVSFVGGRDGDSFVSPAEQRERIEAACERDGLRLLRVVEELDVSGGKSLADRPGLGPAVAAIEAGEADVIVAAYFDRLFRSLATQAEVVGRVEAAGGQVLAVDVGAVSSATAGQWLSGTMLGAVSEYTRRTIRERTASSTVDAIARGVAPWPRITTGYRRGPDKVYVPDPVLAPVVAEGFAMRARGATVEAVTTHLQAHGATITETGVRALLASRVVLGEIHFGAFAPNLHAHKPIVERGVWEAAQRMVVSKGRKSQSDRLLARLGIVVCASCGARMSVGHSYTGGRRYPFYRCAGQYRPCPCRATIAAVRLEEIVVEAVRERLADAHGRAAADSARQQLEHAAVNSQATLDRAIRAFAALAGEPVAAETLETLRAQRDTDREALDTLGPGADAVELTIDDWNALTLDEQRALVRIAIERVSIEPSRSPRKRITVSFRAPVVE